jgi:flagellar basal-body rod protein FlgC
MFESLDISSSALLAQRVRMDTIAGNLANIDTTRSASGQKVPYRRRFAVFAPGREGDASKAGVQVTKIEQDRSPFRKVYEPGHPDADGQGYVRYPNVDLAVETVNALEASRAYEANVTAVETTKSMMSATMRLLA